MKDKRGREFDPDREPDRCPESDTGKHVADWTSVAVADGVESVDTQGLVDVTCKLCGRSGSMALEFKDVDW